MTDHCSRRDLLARRYGTFLWHLPLAAIAIASLLGANVRAALWAPAFTVMGAACIYNAVHCGRLHCYVTGPVFLGAALLSLIRALDLVALPWGWIGLGALVITVLAYALEAVRGKYLRHPRTP